MRGFAVIGAGYGDEGKGVLTNVLTSDAIEDGYNPIVARCNGGGQAAHTVVLQNGIRHVFKHHGSGTLAGAPTYLSEDFIVNPIIFFKEHRELETLFEVHLEGELPKVYSSPEALVTLPMDMMINQELEKSRGDGRHGSCGWGIGETVQRSEAGYAIRVKDLPDLTLEKLQQIKDEYGTKRFEELGLTPPSEFYNKNIDGRFLRECIYFLVEVEPLADNRLEEVADCIIFEGAQGLGLDQVNGHFPHVTRSNTGLANIKKLASANHIVGPELTVIYITRCYNTRHGAGPLEWEDELRGVVVCDETNVENTWQQNLRTAPLDLDILKARIDKDFGDSTYEKQIAITCMDQVQAEFTVAFDGAVHVISKQDTHKHFPKRLGVHRYTVIGHPTGRNAVTLTRTK